jgi:hypothetical protein
VVIKKVAPERIFHFLFLAGQYIRVLMRQGDERDPRVGLPLQVSEE